MLTEMRSRHLFNRFNIGGGGGGGGGGGANSIGAEDVALVVEATRNSTTSTAATRVSLRGVLKYADFNLVLDLEMPISGTHRGSSGSSSSSSQQPEQGHGYTVTARLTNPTNIATVTSNLLRKYDGPSNTSVHPKDPATFPADLVGTITSTMLLDATLAISKDGGAFSVALSADVALFSAATVLSIQLFLAREGGMVGGGSEGEGPWAWAVAVDVGDEVPFSNFVPRIKTLDPYAFSTALLVVSTFPKTRSVRFEFPAKPQGTVVAAEYGVLFTAQLGLGTGALPLALLRSTLVRVAAYMPPLPVHTSVYWSTRQPRAGLLS